MQTTSGFGETLTFVVRLWHEADTAGQRHWRGRVEHIGTGEVRYLERIAELTGYITHWLESTDNAPKLRLMGIPP